MEKIALKKEELKEYITKLEYLKHGGNGIIYKYRQTELLKLFYYNYIKDYTPEALDKIIEDIHFKIDSEHIRRIIYPNHTNSKEKLLELINRLNNTSSNDLFKGFISIDKHLVATILNHYENYLIYEEIYPKLSFKENIYVLNKVIKLVEELINNGIYPTDLRLENIMVNEDNLDVKLIDLDDNTTMLTDTRNNYYMYQTAKRTANIRKKIINS